MVRFDDIKGKTVDIVDAILAECGSVWNRPDAADDMRLRLGIEEIVENVVVYAYPEGSGWIEAEADDGCVLTVRDGGVAFDPTATCEFDKNASLDERCNGGMGIFIAKNYFDISYRRDGNVNCLRLQYKIK